MPPPPTKKLKSKEYNPEFSLVMDTICSSQDVRYTQASASPQHKYQLAASFTSLLPDEMALSLKNILDWLLGRNYRQVVVVRHSA